MDAVVLFVIAVVVAGIFYGVHRAKQAKIEKARTLAARYGFEVDIDAKKPPPHDFDLFGKGNSRKVSFQFWKSGQGESVFAYQFTTGSGKNRTTHHHTCALVPLPFAAPHTKLGPEGFWSGLGKTLGIRDIEVESPAFNDRYRVSSDDERFAITMLDGPTVDWFVSEPSAYGLRFELWGPWLLCITGKLPIEQYFGFHDWAATIPDHLPDVLTSLYPA